MKYTKDDLSKMGENSINDALYNLSSYAKAKLNFNFLEWNHIMPLAVEHKLTFAPHVKSMWICYQRNKPFSPKYDYFDASPQRAIACCLILVLQEQQQ
jgi:hypothetical protein